MLQISCALQRFPQSFNRHACLSHKALERFRRDRLVIRDRDAGRFTLHANVRTFLPDNCESKPQCLKDISPGEIAR